ncbi:Blm10 protein [Maudiozyma humilis]|uniref:Blm10 protein n=1 Tax=Maudiozyma humilis TaxID=51915 RepID=A0AAV5S038_MAUHU|nr:Blm10 protein [Kazachstania humilis]
MSSKRKLPTENGGSAEKLRRLQPPSGIPAASPSPLQRRLQHYNLDYREDYALHIKELYDPESRWFSRDVKLPFDPVAHLPYDIEAHTDRARYICHIVLNLYVSISALDIQGLITLSDKEITALQRGMDDLGSANGNGNTTSSRNQREVNADRAMDIADFDEGDDDDEQFEDNEYMEFSGPDFSAVGRINADTRAIVNVNHWTNELKNCLDFNFPLSLRKALATVYYHLAMVQGQKIFRQLHVEVLELLINPKSHGTNFTELLKNDGLVLDHRPLLQFLVEFMPYPDSDYVRYDITSRDDLNLFRLLLKLAHMSKVFFDDKNQQLLPEIMDSLKSSVSPLTLPIVLPIITSLVPYHYNRDTHSIIDYIPFCFGIWGSTSANIAIDTHMYDFVGNILENAHTRAIRRDDINISFGKCGLFSQEQMTFLFNRLQGHLRTNGQIHSYSRTVRPFVYCINGGNNETYFRQLSDLAKSIETFVHPSNSGFWTKPIAKFVHSFIKMYHGRVKKEEKMVKKYGKSHGILLDSPCHSKITSIFLNILFIGAQNKNPDISNYYISCFGYLVEMDTTGTRSVLDRILVELYESLSDEYINSRHRIIASLKQFSRVVRFMVMDKLYRAHIMNILYMLTLKLDMNDINLSSNLINGIVSIASFAPFESPLGSDEYINFESNTLPFVEQHFYHLKGGNESSTFKYEEATLSDAFRGSTTILETVLITYVDKMFKLVDTELEDGFITKFNQTTMIMLQTMDDDLFKKFTEQFLKQYWDADSFGERNPNFEMLTTTLAAIVKRDGTLSKGIFESLVINIKNQIERGAGSVRSNTEIQKRDLKLVLHLTALNDILRQSYEFILTYSDQLIDAMEYIFEKLTNPPIDIITSILVHSACYSLTVTEVRETRLFSAANTLTFDEKWGALQFDERRFNDKNMQFKWHVPTEAEVELTIEIFSRISKMCIDKLDHLIKLQSTNTVDNDLIQKYILILTHSLSGASLLFDADYVKIINSKNVASDDLASSATSSRFASLSPYALFDEHDDGKDEVGPDLTTVETEFNMVNPLQLGTESLKIPEIPSEGNSASNSQLPSRINTPTLNNEENSDNEIVNNFSNSSEGIFGTTDPSFKDLDIFSYNYFFGNDTDSKLDNVLYHKINNERLHVGHFYHKVFNFLSSNDEANINIYQALLHGLKVWFTDVGKENIFTDDPNLGLDYEFLENILSLSHLDEPFTRSLFAVRANNFHQSRVMMHSTIHSPSKLEAKLLNDVIGLSCSIYPDIFKPAQGCLLHSMKLLIGSYGTVISTILSKLRQNLQQENNKSIEVILRVLCLRKIQRRLLTDYGHLQELMLLLLDCFKINEMDISLFAEKILLELVLGVKIPSSICVYNSHIYSPIDPADNVINDRVELIKKCKDKKRRMLLSLLTSIQNRLVDELNNGDGANWKIPTFIIRFISKIQSSLELETTPQSIRTIFDQTKERHPEMVHLVVRTFLAISNKIISLSDYEYDISRGYQSTYDPPFVSEINTSGDVNFHDTFKKEMSNFENPSYFIDGKAYVGWLCWGKPIKVLQPGRIEVNLRDNDTEVLSTLGNLLSKEWLGDITKCLIQDNETRCVFSSGDVSFFVLVIILITKKLTTTVTLQDLFDLCANYYDRYDKASMILSIEIFAALVSGSRYMTTEEKQARDAFAERFLSDSLDIELNQDAFEIWGTLCWWLPSVVDIRRCPPFFKSFTDIKYLMNKNNEQFGNQASRILMLSSVIMGMDFRSPNLDPIIEGLIFDHPYDQVRESIGKLLSTITQSKSTPSFGNAEELMQAETHSFHGLGMVLRPMFSKVDSLIRAQFEQIESEYALITAMTPQQKIKTGFYYRSSTMLHWLQDLIRSSNKTSVVPYIDTYILPFLLRLMKEKDMCALGGMDATTDFLAVAYLPMQRDNIQRVIDLMCAAGDAESKAPTTSYDIKLKLAFLQHLISSELLQLSEAQKKQVLDFIVSQVYNATYVEVRTRAADVLSDMVHNIHDPAELEALIARFSQKLDNFTWEQKKQLSKTDVAIHGSVIALGAVISAFPYVFPLPKWMPRELSKLSSWARTSGAAGRSAKDTISEFKKVRADTWRFDRTQFTTEELEDLEGVLWRSYYA